MQIVIFVLLLIIAIAVAPTLVAILAVGAGAVFLSSWLIKLILSVIIGTVAAIGFFIYFLVRDTTPPAIKALRRKSVESDGRNEQLPTSAPNVNGWLSLTADAIERVHSGNGTLSFSLERGDQIAQWVHWHNKTTLYVSPYAGWSPYSLSQRNATWLSSRGFKNEGVVYQKQFDPRSDWNYPELSLFLSELFNGVFGIKRVNRVRIDFDPEVP